MTKTNSAKQQINRPGQHAPEANDWLTVSGHEGQLSLDIYQNTKDLIIKSTIAGARPEDIVEADFLFRECYWGPFSRSIILPINVQPDKIKASIDNGVLTVILPKAPQAKQIIIKVKTQ